MRILYLGKTLHEHSGWGRYAWEVVRRVKKAHSVKVLVEEGSSKDCESVSLEPTKGIASLWRNVRRVKRATRDYDLMHALDAWPYGIIAWLATKKIPFFINVVGSYSVAPLDQGLKGLVLKKALSKAKEVFCISHFTKNEVAKRVWLDNLKVVFLGVDHQKFRLADLKRQKNLIISVGAVKRRKGYDVALRAIAELVKKFPNLKYKIVGELDQEGYAESLREYIQENKLTGTVEFVSGLSDDELTKLYNQASVFVLLPQNYKNHFEGFGLVFLEAASSGLPVVGTKGNGVEDAVNDEQNGFLVEQKDPLQAVEAIGKLLSNQELWSKFSKEGLSFAKEFTWESTVKSYIDSYQDAVS